MQIVVPQTLLLRGRTRDYMTRSERRPGYRMQPPRRPKKPKGSPAYLIATLFLLILAYPIGLSLLWVRKLKWHTLVKLLVSVLTGAVFFFLLSIAIAIDTDNPVLSKVQDGIQTGYEAIGQAVEVASDWTKETWDEFMTEAGINIRYVAENGPAAVDAAIHDLGNALRFAYNWGAELIGAPELAPIATATPAPATPKPTATAKPLFATATPAVSSSPAANATPAPTPVPTPVPTPSPSPAPTLQPIGRVTVYNLENGTYYHMSATCNSTTGGIPGTLENAIASGLKPCPRCGVPNSSVLNIDGDIVYLDRDKLYHTSVNCDAFAGSWKHDTLENVFYSGYTACTECGADHHVFEPDEPVSDALNEARFITVYYHSNSTYYHAKSACGQMTGAAAHTLAEAVVLDGKKRCPNCNPAIIEEESASAEATAAPAE